MMSITEYTINKINERTDEVYDATGTLEELLEFYQTWLDNGQAWADEENNVQINTHPTTVDSLVHELNNAINNQSIHAIGGKSLFYYELGE